MICIPYFGCFLVFICVRFLSLFLALQQSQVHRKQIPYASFIAFSSLEVLPVCLLQIGQTFRICDSSLMMDNDVSTHIVVGLVVLIPTSPRSSKTESGCKRYCRFRIIGS